MRIRKFLISFFTFSFLFVFLTPLSFAQTPTCTNPPQVTSVKIDYPSCPTASTCSLTTATCSWAAVAGAASYKVTITNTDTNTAQPVQSIPSTTTQYSFAVTANKTYRCDVAAVNSCGTAGTSGTATQLCSVPATFSSPTPTVTTVPTAVVSSPPQLSCGYGPCGGANSCIAGLVCVQASNGQSYCTYPTYQTACQQTPSISSCCTAPQTVAPVVTVTPQPVIPKTGSTSPTEIVGIIGGITIMISGILFFLL